MFLVEMIERDCLCPVCGVFMMKSNTKVVFGLYVFGRNDWGLYVKRICNHGEITSHFFWGWHCKPNKLTCAPHALFSQPKHEVLF